MYNCDYVIFLINVVHNLRGETVTGCQCDRVIPLAKDASFSP